MDRNQAKVLLPIIKAFGEGKDIEMRSKNPHAQLNGWAKMDDFIFGNFEYRIKQESTYRHFKDAEECWQEMQKHQPFGWVKYANKYISISAIDSNNNYEIDFDDYTFADGTPFGVKEEE